MPKRAAAESGEGKGGAIIYSDKGEKPVTVKTGAEIFSTANMVPAEHAAQLNAMAGDLESRYVLGKELQELNLRLQYARCEVVKTTTGYDITLNADDVFVGRNISSSKQRLLGYNVTAVLKTMSERGHLQPKGERAFSASPNIGKNQVTFSVPENFAFDGAIIQLTALKVSEIQTKHGKEKVYENVQMAQVPLLPNVDRVNPTLKMQIDKQKAKEKLTREAPYSLEVRGKNILITGKANTTVAVRTISPRVKSEDFGVRILTLGADGTAVYSLPEWKTATNFSVSVQPVSSAQELRPSPVILSGRFEPKQTKVAEEKEVDTDEKDKTPFKVSESKIDFGLRPQIAEVGQTLDLAGILGEISTRLSVIYGNTQSVRFAGLSPVSEGDNEIMTIKGHKVTVSEKGQRPLNVTWELGFANSTRRVEVLIPINAATTVSKDVVYGIQEALRVTPGSKVNLLTLSERVKPAVRSKRAILNEYALGFEGVTSKNNQVIVSNENIAFRQPGSFTVEFRWSYTIYGNRHEVVAPVEIVVSQESANKTENTDGVVAAAVLTSAFIKSELEDAVTLRDVTIDKDALSIRLVGAGKLPNTAVHLSDASGRMLGAPASKNGIVDTWKISRDKIENWTHIRVLANGHKEVFPIGTPRQITSEKPAKEGGEKVTKV